MAVTFNVAVLDSENYIIEDNRKTIAKNYLKSWFIIDILSCFPFGLISISNNLSSSAAFEVEKVYRIIKLIKLFRIFKIIKD